jgi:hypothetical protein
LDKADITSAHEAYGASTAVLLKMAGLQPLSFGRSTAQLVAF